MSRTPIRGPLDALFRGSVVLVMLSLIGVWIAVVWMLPPEAREVVVVVTAGFVAGRLSA